MKETAELARLAELAVLAWFGQEWKVSPHFSQMSRRRGKRSIFNRCLPCGGLETPATAGLETGATGSCCVREMRVRRPERSSPLPDCPACASNRPVLYFSPRRLCGRSASGFRISQALPETGKVNFYRAAIL